MLKACIVAVIVVAWVSGEAASAYLKGFEDGEIPERGMLYDPGLLKRIQSYLDSEDRQRFTDADLPAKRQSVRYNQCYFNPISCFKKRK